jgi:hypothetical protein
MGSGAGLPDATPMTLPVISDDSRRTGATWVAGTGAFLLLAAAAVFVAVRWDQLPDAAKLGLLGALTGAFLVGGRALRRTLPATGDVLFHLGALLVPVDVAALHLRTGLGWRSLVLAEGVVAVAALAPLAAVSGSVVLGWAAGAGVAVLAAGVAATTPVPAPLALAAAAVAASLAGRPRIAVMWAAVAGLAPALGLLVVALLREAGTAGGTGVLTELGLAGRTAGLLAMVSGAMATVVIGIHAHRRRDPALGAVAIATAVVSVATTWTAAEIDGRSSVLALPAAFLVVELLLAVAQRDAFWHRLGAAGGAVVEIVAGALTVPLVALVLYAPFVEVGFGVTSDGPGWSPDLAAGASLATLTVAWLLAGARRQTASGLDLSRLALRSVTSMPTSVHLALSAIVAVEVATASTMATAVALLVFAAGFAAVGYRDLPALAAGSLAFWAPVTTWQHPAASVVAGLVGGAVVAEAAVRRMGGGGLVGAWLLAAAATGTTLVGCAAAAGELGTTPSLALAVVGCWGVAWSLDRAGSAVGNVARMALIPISFLATAQGPATAVTLLAAITLLWVVDAVRSDEPRIALGASLTVQLLVAAVGDGAGLAPAAVGLLLCTSAIVWSGMALTVPPRWLLPFAAAAGAAGAIGLAMATPDGRMLSHSLLVVGGLVLAAGIVLARESVAHVGGVLLGAGVIGHLVVAEVRMLEAYVAPVAAHLLLAGWSARRRRFVSSWVAFGPAIALLGGAGVAERFAGGAGWHAVLAGAVGVTAVAAGGALRLAGPLLLGTALVVVVTVTESLTTLAGVPTWAWLATGGCLLLGVGVGLERTDTSPAEAGRRLVDVVGERFD